MTYYGDLTDAERIERINHEVERAVKRWEKSRERLTRFVENELMTSGGAGSNTFEEAMYADADVKVWRETQYWLEANPGEDDESPEDKITRVRRAVRRAVQGYTTPRSSSAISNLIRQVEHETWLEVAELLDPSW